MSYGSPIVFSEDTLQRRFLPLAGISPRRDDPNSFNESLLQELIDATPNVLPVREYLPSSTTLFSLGREVPVDLGANNGYIDNLLVTNDGYLVIVETKLYRNPEGIREVIAQTLQYGMAVGQMPLMELEARIKRGQSPALNRSENIRDCVSRQAAEQNRPAALGDDFDEALERHLRRGEILLLIVSDGIHIGVERVTHWLNEQGNSSPFKFGLVELKFYTYGNERLVVPRTVLKTREVSRHVVVVDIRPTMEVSATAEITDEFRNVGGGKVKESRAVKSAQPLLNRNQLLKLVSSEDLPAITQIMDDLEMMGFDQSGTATCLRFGFTYPSEDGTFIPIAYFGKGDVYLSPPTKVLSALGAQTQLNLQAMGLELGFYRPEQVNQPNAPSLNVKYRWVGENIPKLTTFLEEYRDRLTTCLQHQGL
ncbi:MAG: hypothetical protein WBJ68_01390 [Candidatus Dechloromonas phosphoritropha]